MPKLPDADRATYVCPKCLQTVQRTKADLTGPLARRMFAGRLPAFLLCGRCLEKNRAAPAPLMWRTDIHASERHHALWGCYGQELQEVQRKLFARVSDVSYAKVRRYVVRVIGPLDVVEPGKLLEVAERQVEALKHERGRFCAATVHFATTEQDAIEGRLLAVVDYAPAGVWADADQVKPGDYKRHEYRIVR